MHDFRSGSSARPPHFGAGPVPVPRIRLRRRRRPRSVYSHRRARCRAGATDRRRQDAAGITSDAPPAPPMVVAGAGAGAGATTDATGIPAAPPARRRASPGRRLPLMGRLRNHRENDRLLTQTVCLDIDRRDHLVAVKRDVTSSAASASRSSRSRSA